MRFKIKNIDINTGGILIAVINRKDAQKFSLHHGDRIAITRGKKRVVAIINITDSERLVGRGFLGCFEELSTKLKIRNKTEVFIQEEKKPNSLKFIKKKLRGEKLSYAEFEAIINDIVKGELTDIEMTYFVAACYTHELTNRETADLTRAMIRTGEILKLKRYPIMDKHCVGGVAGNRTTMMAVPIIASAGLTIPKTSSRAITSAAGTSDTVEVLANVSFPLKEMERIVKKTNGCLVWGGAINLAPADDKIIKVEHPLSLDPAGQLLASILAKKKSVSATHVLVDIPIGKGAKIESIDEAIKLKKRFESIGKMLDMKIKAIITDGSQPIGNGIGPALEARDVLWTLRNDPRGSLDLRKKSLELTGMLLEMGGKAKKGEGKAIATKILDSGMAYKKFIEIIKAQGGKEIDPEDIRVGRFQHTLKNTKKKGKIMFINNRIIAKMARTAGAPSDKAAGVYIFRNVGELVERNEKLLTIYADSKKKLKFAKDIFDKTSPFEIE